VSASCPVTNGSTKLLFSYDYMSRRVRKDVVQWNGSLWQTNAIRSFSYDGWLLVSEIVDTPTPQHAVTNVFTWGLDLSGSLQGAGGVGGLVSAVLPNPTNSLQPTACLYTYCANGNVSELVDTTGTNILAHYEYSPFGEAIVATGPLAEVNAIRFSTKYWDVETGLGYWGYRWYSMEIGRWLSSDPIVELGNWIASDTLAFLPEVLESVVQFPSEDTVGPNLFVANDPLNQTDAVGEQANTVCRTCSPPPPPAPTGITCTHNWDCRCPRGSKTGKKQKVAKVANGCSNPVLPGQGGKDNPMLKCSFRAACDNHDCCYGQCNSQKTACDGKFYNDMVAACEACAVRWERGIRGAKESLLKDCKRWAWIYYQAVKRRGQDPFDENQKNYCEDCCCP